MPPIVVIGAGIIGLTTAIRLLQANHKVIIVADYLPTDPLSPTYASSSAGAHHLSFAADNDDRQRKLDMRTFEVMWDEETQEGDSSGIMKLTQVEFYGRGAGSHIQFFESLPEFRVHAPMTYPEFANHTVSFRSFTMDTPIYLRKLLAQIHALGGQIYSHHLTSLQNMPTLPFLNGTKPGAIINCAGIGAIIFGEPMYPIRGHVIILDAPWIKEGRTRQIGELEGDGGGERTYVIPRRSGQVIVGGTREENDWYPYPRPEASHDIKRRALEIYPELVPPHKRTRSPPQPEDLDSIIIREVVAFRPARKGGLRLERGEDVAGVPLIHNVGHSGAGWQSSWGCAEEVVKIVQEVFSRVQTKL